jgi:hypothetical protein
MRAAASAERNKKNPPEPDPPPFLSSPQNPMFPHKLLKMHQKYRRHMWRVFPSNLLRLM